MESDKSLKRLERADAVEEEEVGSYPMESGSLPRSKKEKLKKLEHKKAYSLEEAQLELQHQSKSQSRPVLPRAQTVGDRLHAGLGDSINSRSSFMKHNKTFHRLFPDVPESEDLLHAYICALQREVPYHGRLYITDNNVCFHSSVLLKATKVVIPVSIISVVKKQNTALLVPNALSIRTTTGEKFVFVSLRNRDGCYDLLRSVSSPLDDCSANSSPLFSSAENSFDHVKAVDSSQSSLTDAWEELDAPDSGLVMQPPSPTVGPGSVPNASPVTLRSSAKDQDVRSTEVDSRGSWMQNMTDRARSALIQRQATNLNTLLLIYLLLVVLLVLSSGYIGLRIVALEEQLASLGALPEFTLHSGYKDT